MLELFSGMIVDRLLRNRVIRYDDIEIYMYGMTHLLAVMSHTIAVVAVGIMLGQLFHGILFMVAFAALRTYAGGYHASTPGRCLCLSMGIFTTVLLAMKYLTLSDSVCWGILALSGICILFLSPVEAVNKPLDRVERKICRRKSIVIWLTELAATVILMMTGMKDLAVAIVLANMVTGSSLVIGCWF